MKRRIPEPPIPSLEDIDLIRRDINKSWRYRLGERSIEAAIRDAQKRRDKNET